jgi:hypothetical protein
LEQKRKSPEDFFKRVRENGSEKYKDIFNRDEVKKKLCARMIKELGPILTTWQTDKQVCGIEGCGFSILYSDIRKKYYASHGCVPVHPSIPSLTNGDTPLANKVPLPGGLRR